jgi:pimeloyl-ACP methyl ester carboxylesterase
MIGWIIIVGVGLVGAAVAALALFTAWTARQVEKRVPPEGRFVEIDGARIHYVDEGSGPPLLLIHGLAGQSRNFTCALLGKLKQDFRVVILDRPGSGYSTRPPGAPSNIAAQARTISRLCQALGLERPLVVGHSLGGPVALGLALNHPEQVAGLALLAPVTHQAERTPPPFDGLAIRSPLLRRLIASTVATPLSIANRERALDILFGPQPVPVDFAIAGGGLLALRPCSFVGASADLMAAHADLGEMTARYKELTMPLGILFGTADRVLDPAVHGNGLLAKVPGADLELIEGAGHMILIASADDAATSGEIYGARAFRYHHHRRGPVRHRCRLSPADRVSR